MAGSLRIGMISGYSYLPNDTPIPYVDVETKAGSLMYFPPHWWHEVHNIHDDQFGLACGFRPKETVTFTKEHHFGSQITPRSETF